MEHQAMSRVRRGSSVSSPVVNQSRDDRVRVAVVGAGITGSVAASYLSKHFSDAVHIFDQGRRGPGGRASHRSVRVVDQTTLSDDDVPPIDDTTTFQFDHGCQFFRSDSMVMQKELVDTWLTAGWVAPWKARFGCLSASSLKDMEEHDSAARRNAVDFFGIPSIDGKDVYVGVGGMHQLPRSILRDSNAIIHRGTRVVSVKRNSNKKWDLYAVEGDAAYHDTKELDAASVEMLKIGEDFDVVIFTDISSASDSWHRASAGIPDSFRKQIPTRVRIPLFSCMVALKAPIANILPLDAFVVSSSDLHDKDTSALWFAARSNSKPGFPHSDNSHECWTLISSPSFAVQQIKKTTMRDPVTGAFRPQNDEYLNTSPGPALVEAFFKVVQNHNNMTPEGNRHSLPEVLYLQAQRWGSGLPAPEHIARDFEDICGTRYASSLTSSLVYPKPSMDDDSNEILDFVADDQLGLYYAGDFCSFRNPGFEAAALSGLDVAKHITLKAGDGT